MDLYGEGKEFQRVRRITGYLVGDLSRFNTAKRHEVADRVKHSFSDRAVNAQFSGASLKLLKKAQ